MILLSATSTESFIQNSATICNILMIIAFAMLILGIVLICGSLKYENVEWAVKGAIILLVSIIIIILSWIPKMIIVDPETYDKYALIKETLYCIAFGVAIGFILAIPFFSKNRKAIFMKKDAEATKNELDNK